MFPHWQNGSFKRGFNDEEWIENNHAFWQEFLHKLHVLKFIKLSRFVNIFHNKPSQYTLTLSVMTLWIIVKWNCYLFLQYIASGRKSPGYGIRVNSLFQPCQSALLSITVFERPANCNKYYRIAWEHWKKWHRTISFAIYTIPM